MAAAAGFTIHYKQTAILVDGGHLRTMARKAGHDYDPDFIEAFCTRCKGQDEDILRIFYYDCPPYRGRVKAPVSGGVMEFDGSDAWLFELARRNLFAVRKGELKFRGFALKSPPQKRLRKDRELEDDDFRPVFQQKGVDMRIGLDIATLAARKTVERIILVTADTDCAPAMKHARIEGLQVVLVRVDGNLLSRSLQWHADFIRDVSL